MRGLVAFCFVVAVLAAPTTHAQGWGLTTPSGQSRVAPFMTMPGNDWRRCSNVDRNLTLEQALESCNRMLADHPGRGYQGAIYWQRAMRYIDAGDIKLGEDDLRIAASAFADYIEANPREYVGYNNRAAVLTRMRRYDEALADYDRAIAMDSNASSSHLGRGGILFRRGDYAGASEAFDRAARIAARTGGSTPRLHTARCEVRAAAGVELDRARDYCDRAIRNSDNPSYARASRGFLLFMQGDLDGAAADFARAIEEDPYNAPAVYGGGVVAVRQGRTTEGEADIARAQAMDSFEVEYFANAGLRP